MGLSIDLAELIRRAIDARLRELWTAEPAIVQSYDGASRTVDVQPAVQRTLPNEAGELGNETLPVVSNVPVAFLGSRGALASFDLVRGDEGLLIVCSSASGPFRGSGEVSPPGDLRRHALGSAVFIPLHLSDKRKGAPDPAEAQGTGSGFIVGAEAIKLGSKDATRFAAFADTTDARLDALEEFAANHKHASSGAVGAPALGGTPGESTACEKVTIE